MDWRLAFPPCYQSKQNLYKYYSFALCLYELFIHDCKAFKHKSVHKLFNRNTIEISHSCVPNYDFILKGINKNKIGKATSKTCKSKVCNPLGLCNRRCIAKNLCEKSSVVYKPTVHVNDGSIYKEHTLARLKVN